MCQHSLHERETACADGMCPLCLCEKMDRWLDIIADWANDEGISFGATERLSHRLEP